ncbi:hypothetical protein QZH41_017076 [Actinostola sp. cb2023]|nr:hypothetical protein QZH41_017076 [Actinostola sp. cb2023]
MKQSVAVILLVAFVAQIYASPELDDFLIDASDDSDRHPYVQCKIDLYDCMRKGAQKKSECLKAYYTCMKQLIPTIPPFVIQCKDELKSCVASASGFVEKGKCFIAFAKCLKNGGPVSPSIVYRDDVVDPPRHPYVQCKIDLYDCIRRKNKDRLQCLKDYKNCMAVLIPTIPPFVIACKDELKGCVAGASTIMAKATCFKEFGKCLINKGPSPPALDAGDYILNLLEDAPAPTRHPYFQCKIDLYKCMKDGQKGKVECLKEYKSCMAQLIPTIPPHVLQCRDKLKACYSAASGWRAKAKCFVDFGKCLRGSS